MDTNIPNFYTATDYASAGKYAMYRINKDKCLNEEFKKKYPGTDYILNRDLIDINCPTGLPDCKEVFGRCKFTTKESCLEQGGDYRDMGKGKNPYLEWREGKAGESGKCVFGNFALRNWCEDPSSRNPGKFVRGQTDVPPFNYNEEQGVCEMTKDYCSRMGVDYTSKNDDLSSRVGFSIPDCKESEGQKFAEKWIMGKTLFRGLKRGVFTRFINDVSKDYLSKGPLAYYDFLENTLNGKYKDELGLGNNDIPPIQPDTNDVPVGTNTKENFSNLSKKLREELREKFMEGKINGGYIPKTVIGDISPDKILSKELLIPNFGGPNLNLYVIYNHDKFSLGFIFSEIQKKYPDLIRKNENDIYIVIPPELTKKDNYLKRIYFCYLNPEWFFDLISKNFLYVIEFSRKFGKNNLY